MAFDEELAARIRSTLGKRKGLSEKKMFGGLAFLLNGNMCCGVHGSEMILRLDPKDTDAALNEKHVRAFDLTGRPMKGWLLIAGPALAGTKALARWVEVSVEYASALPSK